MTREEAIRIVKTTKDWEELHSALQELIPELNESNDERIRKDIIALINFCVSDGSAVSPGSYTTKEEAIDYLERQKEQNPVNFNDDTELGLERALQIVKDAKGNLCGYQSDDGIYECDHAIQTLECILKSGIEQKSTEWSEEDKNTLECSAPFKRFVDMVHSVDKDEFTEFEYSIINFVLACCDKSIAMTPKGIHCYAKTILNIVKKEFTPKNCGWTDEEETVLHNACEFIRHRLNDSVCRNGNIGGMDYNILYEKLKSLRPQPEKNWRHYIWNVNMRFDYGALVKYDNGCGFEIVPAGNKPKKELNGEYIFLKDICSNSHWKPSKEQMEWLKDVIETVPMTCRQQVPLESLYADLQKLI